MWRRLVELLHVLRCSTVPQRSAVRAVCAVLYGRWSRAWLTANQWLRLQIHARLGEIHYMAATASGNGGGEDTYESHMAESVKRFCRSIELCDDYLRGYYGLKIVGCQSSPIVCGWRR